MRQDLRELRHIFPEALARYCDDVDRKARKAGLVKLPSKRELAHFTWLARFQLGEDFECIAKAAGVTEGAVERAVRRTAKLIGLTLRSLPRHGRPRGRVELHGRAPRTVRRK